MKNEHIDFILEVEQYLTAFRKTMVMRMPPADENKVRAIHQEVMGNPIPMCGSCFVDSFTSLVIRARFEKETQLPTLQDVENNALILAQLADDEQKPKRRKK
jgi:hypothetical protein